MTEADIKIPHASKAFIVRDPPFKVLVVATKLAERPGQTGFNAEAKYEMMNAIERLHDTREFDHPKISWGNSDA